MLAIIVLGVKFSIVKVSLTIPKVSNQKKARKLSKSYLLRPQMNNRSKLEDISYK